MIPAESGDSDSNQELLTCFNVLFVWKCGRDGGWGGGGGGMGHSLVVPSTRVLALTSSFQVQALSSGPGSCDLYESQPEGGERSQ